MQKFLMTATSGLVSLGLAGLMPPTSSGGPDDPPPPHKKKGDSEKKKGEPGKKGEGGPAGDLRRAYDLLRRIKSDDGPSGRSDERLRDWTDRAAKFYRRAVQAQSAGDTRLAHEYGAAAHDLARAVDHARNASRFDRPDPDLPPPPDGHGPEGDGERTRRDLRRAFDRISEAEGGDGPEAKFYLDAARDLYNAARRDAQGDRTERSGELARAAEALTHVPEHLARVDGPQEPRERPEPKARKKGEGPEPKARKKGERPEHDDDLPPPLPPRD